MRPAACPRRGFPIRRAPTVPRMAAARKALGTIPPAVTKVAARHRWPERCQRRRGPAKPSAAIVQRRRPETISSSGPGPGHRARDRSPRVRGRDGHPVRRPRRARCCVVHTGPLIQVTRLQRAVLRCVARGSHVPRPHDLKEPGGRGSVSRTSARPPKMQHPRAGRPLSQGHDSFGSIVGIAVGPQRWACQPPAVPVVA